MLLYSTTLSLSMLPSFVFQHDSRSRLYGIHTHIHIVIIMPYTMLKGFFFFFLFNGGLFFVFCFFFFLNLLIHFDFSV